VLDLERPKQTASTGANWGRLFIGCDGATSHPVANYQVTPAALVLSRLSYSPSSNLHGFQPRLPVFPPPSAPASSPSAPSADEPDDHEQQYRADRGFNDLRDDARTEMDPKLRKYQARNDGPCYSHNEIADEAQARTLDDLAQPAGRDADSQYDEKAFTRCVHFRVFIVGPPSGGTTTIDLSKGGHCAKLIRSVV
jgi:hypothetical protein